MTAERYTQGTARAIAQRVYEKYGPQIHAAALIHGVRPEWLAGLTGMENPNCREWPDRRSQRYESGVFANLRALRDRGTTPKGRPSYNGIAQAQLQGTSDEALRALSTSYGQTQIMGYHVLGALALPLWQILPKDDPALIIGEEEAQSNPKLAHLRDPAYHYYFAAYLMAHSEPSAKYVRRANVDSAIPLVSPRRPFTQLAHIWNSGQEWDGENGNIRTWSPHYMHNTALTAAEYVGLMRVPMAHQRVVAPTPTPQMQGLTSERATMQPPALPLEGQQAGPDEGGLDFFRTGFSGGGGQQTATELPATDPSERPAGPSDAEASDDSVLDLGPQTPAAPFDPLDPANFPVEEEAQSPPQIIETETVGPLRAREEADVRTTRTTIFDRHAEPGGEEQAQLPDPSDRSTATEESADVRDGRILARTMEREDEDRGQRQMSDIFRHLGPDDIQASPNISRIPNPAEDAALKPGWKTTEAQLIALVTTLAALWLAFKPNHADSVNSTAAQVVSLIQNIGPIITVGALVWNFTTSRGKTKSNALWANAAAQITNPAPMLAAQGLFGGKLDKVLDAARVGATIAGAVAPGKGGKVAGQVGDILNRIGDRPAQTQISQATVDEIVSALRELDERLYKIERGR